MTQVVIAGVLLLLEVVLRLQSPVIAGLCSKSSSDFAVTAVLNHDTKQLDVGVF